MGQNHDCDGRRRHRSYRLCLYEVFKTLAVVGDFRRKKNIRERTFTLDNEKQIEWFVSTVGLNLIRAALERNVYARIVNMDQAIRDQVKSALANPEYDNEFQQCAELHNQVRAAVQDKNLSALVEALGLLASKTSLPSVPSQGQGPQCS